MTPYTCNVRREIDADPQRFIDERLETSIARMVEQDIEYIVTPVYEDGEDDE